MKEYDALADLMYSTSGWIPGVDYVPGAILQYDFDNGNILNDAFYQSSMLGTPDLGLGPNEVLSAPGDSGGDPPSLAVKS